MVKRYKRPVIRSINPGDVMYNIMTIANAAILVYLKIVKSVNPVFSSQGKKKQFFFLSV